MKVDNFNLESIKEVGSFHFNFAGNAVGGGEWWSVHSGDRRLFHLRVHSQTEVENIYIRQKHYPYYCPTEQEHFFFFEDGLYQVTPSLVDPLAEMIILYFVQMTKRLKPEIRHIQKEFGQSLSRFDELLKKKAEAGKLAQSASTEVPKMEPSRSVDPEKEKDLQKERMRERRRRLGLPEDG